MRAMVLIDMMQDFPVPKLDRKWKNPQVLAQIELQKQKYPEFFETGQKIKENFLFNSKPII